MISKITLLSLRLIADPIQYLQHSFLFYFKINNIEYYGMLYLIQKMFIDQTLKAVVQAPMLGTPSDSEWVGHGFWPQGIYILSDKINHTQNIYNKM